MEKEFIPYEQALALKELGFDESCLAYYFHSEFSYWIMNSGSEYKHCANEYFNNNEVSAPLYQQAFRWFREKYDMCSFIQRFEGRVYDYEITSDIFKEVTDFKDGYFDTYQEAVIAYLKKLIEIVKRKNK